MDDLQDNKLIKKIGDKDSVTQTQMKELIRCRDDIEYFAQNYVYVQNNNLGTVLFTPRDYQSDMINIYDKSRFSVVVAPRQCGKSQTTVVFLLHQTIFFRDIQIGVAANKLDQAKELLERFRFSYESLPFWMKPPVKSYNVFSVSFTNGSSVESAATTGNTFRGKSKTILYLDEFAHIKPNVLEEFWTSLLPVISSGGKDSRTKIIISSTPNGTEGLFAKLYHDAINDSNGFTPLFVDWRRIPGRDDEFKRQMMEKMTYEKYMQEFESAFISTKGTLIAPFKLEDLKSKDPISKHGELRIFEPFKKRKLAIVADVGTGIGQDYSTIQIFDIDTLAQVGEYRDNRINTTDFTKEFIKIIRFFKNGGAREIYYTVEANSIGNTVIALLDASTDTILDDENVTMVNQRKSKHKGFTTSSKTKMSGCMTFKNLVEHDKFQLHSKFLISELKFFVKAGQTFKAETGMHDDLVMGCVILTNMLSELSNWEEGVFDNINDIDVQLDNEEDIPLPFMCGEDDFEDGEFDGWSPVEF
jgi:hypothetical protein